MDFLNWICRNRIVGPTREARHRSKRSKGLIWETDEAGKFREILAEASSFGPGERCTREPSGAPARLLVNVENGNGNVHERKQLIRAAPPHGLGLGLRQRRLDRHDRHGRCRPWLWHVVFSVRLLVYPCIFFLRVCENVREKAHKVTQRLALLRKKDRWAG